MREDAEFIMVILKQPEEIEKIRASNLVVAEVLKELKKAVKPGITTRELDRLAEDLSRSKKVQARFQGLYGVSVFTLHLG